MKTTSIVAGQKFNRLTALHPAGKNKWGRSVWTFVCECGNERIMRPGVVVSGGIKSCGCLSSDRMKTEKPATKHGRSDTRLYRIWAGMIYRCKENSKRDRKYYSERKITVCEEWKSFENFLIWAESNGYSENLTIDRIDNEKGYCPSNCRWATRKEQCDNRRVTVLVNRNGEVHTLNDWADLLGINRGTFRSRYYNGERGEQLFRSAGVRL